MAWESISKKQQGGCFIKGLVGLFVFESIAKYGDVRKMTHHLDTRNVFT